MTPSQCRLYVLIARDSDRAVIFRRGPSKSVLMIAWDLARDAFQEGQWLRGRLYERRCDLSPGGELLVYFAAKYKRHQDERAAFPTWTAVSRPPYFTALALWPHDSAWNGGGLFDADGTLALNHGTRVPPSAPQLAPPPTFAVRPLGGPHGEDDTVQHPRLVRDGWTLVEAGRSTHQPDGDPHFVYDPPRVYSRSQPRVDRPTVLRRIVRGLGRENGPWYVESFEVENARGRLVVLDDAEWADWDHRGDLLVARAGVLLRIAARDAATGLPSARELADLRARTYARCAPPPGYGW